MKNLFVPYEIAKQLKEKGFNDGCLGRYEQKSENGNIQFRFNLNFEDTFCNHNDGDSELIICSSPLYQQATDWFESKHKILITSQKEPFGKWIALIINDYEKIHIGFGNKTVYSNHIDINNDYEGFIDKYDALNKAIEEALKLI